MRRILQAAGFGALAALATITAAQAQYYPPPAYEVPPPGEYPPPPRYRRLPPPGFRCSAWVQSPAGGEAIVCALREPRGLGEPCGCPPPPPPPGYSWGPPLHGRVVR
jgi:hypothetical protein